MRENCDNGIRQKAAGQKSDWLYKVGEADPTGFDFAGLRGKDGSGRGHFSVLRRSVRCYDLKGLSEISLQDGFVVRIPNDFRPRIIFGLIDRFGSLPISLKGVLYTTLIGSDASNKMRVEDDILTLLE